MGDKNPKKGKKPKRSVIAPAILTVEKTEPELVQKKRKPL